MQMLGVYVNKAESGVASKIQIDHLESDEDQEMGLRGCKLVSGDRNVTSKMLKMYRIQEHNRVTYNMATIVLRNIYPADIQYSDNFASYFPDRMDDESDKGESTKMRTILDNIVNQPNPKNEWDKVDVVQEISFRQGKLHVACQSQNV